MGVSSSGESANKMKRDIDLPSVLDLSVNASLWQGSNPTLNGICRQSLHIHGEHTLRNHHSVEGVEAWERLEQIDGYAGI